MPINVNLTLFLCEIMVIIKPCKIGIILVLIIMIGSCKKPAGPGGMASIKGKIYVKNFDAAGYGLISQYYSPGENVYICYGTSTEIGNNVTSSTDGSYQFLYLNKGHYKIFALSRDTSIHVAGSHKLLPVSLEVDITSNTQQFNLPDIIINK